MDKETPLARLNKLMMKQHKQYRMRIQYITYRLWRQYVWRMPGWMRERMDMERK